MSNFGVTADGFKRMTYRDILEELHRKARETYGNDIDLSNNSFLGMWLQNEAWELATMWELAEDVYFSPFIDYNEGLSQDGTGKYISITRKPATRSRGVITIDGEQGFIVPKGFRVADERLNKIFETTEAAEFITTGEIDVPIVSIGVGLDQNVPPNTLVKIVNPIDGLYEVYNRDATIDGAGIESDSEFRERYARSTSRGGSSTRVSVEATILDMVEVVDAYVIENDTMDPMGDIPPKSLAPYVFGGDDTEIAEVILSAKAGGIRSYGSTELTVQDSKGAEHVIGFTRPNVVDVYVKVNLVKDSGYPGDAVVTRAILNYIGGEDSDGLYYKGLRLREDVVIAKVSSSVMCLQGIKDLQVELSTDDSSYVQSNISIAQDEIAKTKHDKVVINYV